MKHFLLIILIVLFQQIATAQSSANYVFSTFSNGSLSLDMNGNSVDMNSGSTLLINYGSNDIRTATQSIGFEFLMLYGTNNAFYRHTVFSVTSNGILRLGEYTQANRYNIAQDGEYGIISPFARDLATHSTGKVHYKLIGTAPNRCLVVEWKNMELDAISSTADGTFQARLYETTGVIEFVYGEMNLGTGSGTTNFQIGISNDDQNTRLVSVRSADNTISTASVINNSYVAGAAIPNLHSTSDGSRRIYRFTPPSVPTAPVAQAYTNIRCNSVQLNWLDQASNEVQYEIFQSANIAGPYSYLTRVAANSTNAIITGLSENTNYYFRVRAVTEGTASNYVDLGLVTTTATCGVCESKQNGDWNQPSTWLCGHVPYSYEDAIIKHQVRINADMWGVNHVTIENGGYLYFDNQNNLDFQINGDLIIDAGGRFHSATDNSSFVYLYGNLIVNGEYDGNRGTNGTEFRFYGIDNVTISGDNSTVCDFYILTVNKGNSKNSILEVLRSISLRTPTGNNQSLNLSNGTFKLSSPSVLAAYSGNGRTINGITSKLWLNHSGAEIKRASDVNAFYVWDFQLDAGTFSNTGGIYFYSEATINSGILQEASANITVYGKLSLNNGSISSVSFSDNGEVYINGGSLTTTTGNYQVEGISKGLSEINAGTVSIGADLDIENYLTVKGGTITIGDELYVDHNGADEYGCLDFSNATMNVAAMVQLTDYATFKMNSGTINSGDGNDNFNIMQGAELIVNGGTINHFGRLTFDNGTLAIQSKFTMTGGTINIDAQHTTNLQNVDVVSIENNTVVNCSGGIITIVDPAFTKDGTGDSEFEVVGVAGSKNFSGLTLRFGNSVSTSAQGTITGVRGFRLTLPATITINHVLLLNPESGGPFSDRDLILTSTVSNTTGINNLTLSNTNCNLILNGNILNISGDLINHGNINGTATNSHLRFIGSIAQSYSGAGTVSSNLQQLTFNNSSSTGVTLLAPLGANVINILDGIVYTSSTNLLSVYGTNAATSLVGGNNENYVSGPLRRYLSTAAAATYLFPVGIGSDYRSIEMNNLIASGNGFITVEAIVGATGGSGGAGLRNSPFNPQPTFWKVEHNVALTSVSNIKLYYSKPISPAHVIGQCNTAINGEYISIGGDQVGSQVVSTTYNLAGLSPSGISYLVIAEIEPLTGTYYVGNPASSPDPARTFLNLTAVAQILRDKVVDDHVRFEMLSTYDDATETLPIIFNVLTTTQTAYDVTIRPYTGVTGTVTECDPGTDDLSMIIIDGISKLIFDGRPGGVGSSSWIFSNTRSTNAGPVFEFRNGSSQIQLNYLTIKSDNSNSLSGAVYFGKSNEVNGNSNNTIQNCIITGYLSSPLHAIYSNGETSKINLNNFILNNYFKNIFKDNQTTRIIYLQDNSSNWTISENKFFYTSPKVFTGDYILYGISITIGNGYTLNGNIFGYADENSTPSGYTQLSGSTGRFIGIHLNTASGTYSNVTNNIFSNIKHSTASTNTTNGVFNPIYIQAGNVNVGTSGNGNIIGSTSNFINYPIQITYLAGGGQTIGIFSSAAFPTQFVDNKIGGIQLNGNYSNFFIGIQTNNANANSDFNVSDNLIGSLTQSNSIQVGNTGDNSIHRIYGIWNYSSSDMTINNNTIANVTGITSSTDGNNCNFGIFSQSGVNTVSNNKIFTLKHSTGNADGFNTPGIMGIYVNSSQTISHTISNNLIYDLENTSTGNYSVKITGIYLDNDNAALPVNTIERNFIHSFKISSTDETSAVCAFLIDDGNHLVANNMVRLGIDKNGTSVTSSHNLYGIYFDGDNLADFYHNTVYIGGTNVTGNANTYSFYKRETRICNIQNNIFVNARSNGSGTGKHYAYWLSFDEAINSDFNIYYTPGTGGVLASYDDIDLPTLRAMQTYSNYKDLHSASTNPNLFDPTGNYETVNLQLTNPTPAEAMGNNDYALVVPDDRKGEFRSGLTPVDIGADAGNYTFNQTVDKFAPTFIYSPILPQTCSTTSVGIFVTIKDQGTGVSNNAGLRPRVWFRDKTTPGAWISSEGSLQTGGTVNDGIWYFELTGLSGGKVYEYYFVAQDAASIPNLGYSKFNTASPNHTDVTTQVTSPDSNVAIDVFSVCVYPKSDYYVGTGSDCNSVPGGSCDFASLTNYADFFYNMNALTIDKNINCYIVTNTQENATYAALKTKEENGSWTISIRPYNNSSKYLVSNSTTNMSQIRMDGTKKYIIDGRYYDGSSYDNNRWLNFVHEKNDQAVFQLKNDAQNNTVKYCSIKASPELNPTGVIYFDVAKTSGNNNNTFDNNIITKNSYNPLNLVYSYGDPNFPNSNNAITNNIISYFRQYAVWITPTGNSDNWTISGNIIYNPANTDTLQNAIRIEAGSGHTISDNRIGGNASDNSGTWTNSGTSEFQGIYLNAGNASKSVIDNNLITNILLSNTNGAISRGIRAIGNSWVDITNNTITYIEKRGNTQLYCISHTTNQPSIISGNSITNITYTSTNDFYGIYNSTDANDISTIENNIVSGINLTNSSTYSDFFGIWLENGQASINHNTIGGETISDKITVTGGNFEGISLRNGNLRQDMKNNKIINVQLSGDRTFRGFYFYDVVEGVAFEVSENLIDNIILTNSGVNTAFYGYDLRDGSVNFKNNICGTNNYGIHNSGAGNTFGIHFNTYAGSSTFENNSLSNFTGNGSVIGLNSDINVTHSILSNFIYNFNIPNNTTFAAIKVNQGTASIQNNFISEITLTNTGTSTNLYGIWCSGGNVSVGTSLANFIGLSGKPIVNNGKGVTNAIFLTGGTPTVQNNIISFVSGNGLTNGIESSANANIIANFIKDISIANEITFSGIKTSANTNHVQGNVIQNISLTSTGANTNLYGIFISGGITNAGTITKNVIGTASNEITNSGTGVTNGIYLTSSTNNSTVSYNEIGYLNSNGAINGIAINTSSNGHQITNNKIENFNIIHPVNFNGLSIATGSGTETSIQNNSISTINHSGDFCGIFVSAGNVSIGTLSGNTIGHASTPDNIISSGNEVRGIAISSPQNVYVTNNYVCNLKSTNISTNGVISGIDISSTGNTTVDKNIIWNISTTSRNTNYSTGKLAVQGIYLSGNASNIINSNSIFNISAFSDVDIHVAGISEAAQNSIIRKNCIYAISNQSTSTGKTANGIVLTRLNNGYLANNMISIGADDNCEYRGIAVAANDASANKRVFYNSVYIGGIASERNSYAFYRGNVNAPLYIRNNIFSNYRNGGSGKHYAFANLNTSNWASSYTNNNGYFSKNSVLGLWNTTDCNLENLRLYTTSDNLSTDYEPKFIHPATCNLHLLSNDACAFNGMAEVVAFITDDFDGNSRSIRPDIGADEFNPTGGNLADYWGGFENSDWFNKNNWGCELLPTSSSNITIEAKTNQPVINNSTPLPVEINHLTIGNHAILSINPGNGLTINGNLTVSANGLLSIVSPVDYGSGEGYGASGSLITKGTVSGNIKLNRFLYSNRFYYVSSPIETGGSNIFTNNPENQTGFRNRNFYKYNEAFKVTPDYVNFGDYRDLQNGWTEAHNGGVSDVAMSVGKGYAAYDDFDKTVYFLGKPNNSNQYILNNTSETLTFNLNDGLAPVGNTPYDGWCLIGNPYPCAIDCSLMSFTNVDKAIYYWDSNESRYQYFTFDSGIGYDVTTAESTIWSGSGNSSLQYILPAQGVFVHANASNPQIIIPNSARVHAISSVNKFKKASPVTKTSVQSSNKNNFVYVQIEGNKKKDLALIRFDNNATGEFDSKFDAYKLITDNADIPFLFSVSDEKKTYLAINVLNDLRIDKIISLGISSQSTGHFTISAKQFKISGYQIYLLDTKNSVYTNLCANSYSFNYQSGTDLTRFKLVFKANSLPVADVQIPNQTATEDVMFAYQIPTNSFKDTDADDVLSYAVTLADGNQLPLWLKFNTVTRTFSGKPSNSDVGSIEIKVQVSDLSGDKASQIFNLIINNVNDAPVLNQKINNQKIYTNKVFSYTLPENSFIDIDAGDILSFDATLTDGSNLPSWLTFNKQTKTFTGTPLKNDEGSYEIRIAATDLAGETCFTDFGIDVLTDNHAPQAMNQIDKQIAYTNNLFSFTFDKNVFFDADHDVLNYTATLSDGKKLPKWISFNDETQTFYGTPDKNDVGTIQILIKAFDEFNEYATQKLIIEVCLTNLPPVIKKTIPNQSVYQNDNFNLSLADKFSEPDNEPLAFIVELADGNELPQWLIFNQKSKLLTGKPSNDDVNTLQIKVTAIDTKGASISTNFELNVIDVNDPPFVTENIDELTAIENRKFEYVFHEYTFFDIDKNEELTYSATLSDGKSLPKWLKFNNSKRQFAGKPEKADINTHEIKLTATDKYGASTSQIIKLIVKDSNNPPTLGQAISNLSTFEDALFTTVISENSFKETDAGDVLTYSVLQKNGSQLPSWLSFDQVTRKLSGTPLNENVGFLELKAIATDKSGASASQNFVLEIVNVNDAPVLQNQITDQKAVEKQNFIFTFDENTFIDIDAGDVLTYSATLANGALLPVWLVFNSQTRTFTGIPTTEQMLTIKITAKDKSNASVSDEFQITVIKATAIEKSESEILKIYPTISNGLFYIELNKPMLINNKVQIFDIKGKLIASYLLSEKKNKIDISFAGKGLYFVEIIQNHEKVSKKIIID